MNKLKLSGLILGFFIIVSNNIMLSQNSITGFVTYHNDLSKPLDGVIVHLYDMSDNVVLSCITNSDGEYLISNIPSDEYNLRVSTTFNLDNPDLMDAYLIFMYMTGSMTLDEAQLSAADINENGEITGFDFAHVLSSLVNGNFTTYSGWEFNEYHIDYTASTNASDSLDFWGTQDGDVDSSWDPSGRIPNILNFNNSQPRSLESGLQIIPVGTEFNGIVSGFNLNINYPSDIIEIVNVIGPDNEMLFNVNKIEGTIKVTWINIDNSRFDLTGDYLFSIEVKRIDFKYSGKLDFILSSGGMILDERGKNISDINIILPSLSVFSNIYNVDVYPNPVVDNIILDINIPEKDYFNIKIFGLTGNIVYDLNTSLIDAGKNTVNINIDFLESGQYTYLIRNINNNFVLPGRFFIIR